MKFILILSIAESGIIYNSTSPKRVGTFRKYAEALGEGVGTFRKYAEALGEGVGIFRKHKKVLGQSVARLRKCKKVLGQGVATLRKAQPTSPGRFRHGIYGRDVPIGRLCYLIQYNYWVSLLRANTWVLPYAPTPCLMAGLTSVYHLNALSSSDHTPALRCAP